MHSLILIAHDIRSCHNVGSLLRTAEGLGVQKIILSGYTPYPLKNDDKRLPHQANKIHRQIHKTALGAEESANWEHTQDIGIVLDELKADGFEICALEQAKDSIALPDYRPKDKVALLIGNEVTGIQPDLLQRADKILEIPMVGQKESFNVVQATAIALYHLSFASNLPM